MMKYKRRKAEVESIKAQIRGHEDERNTECQGDSRHKFPDSKFTWEDLLNYGNLTTWCSKCKQGFAINITATPVKESVEQVRLRALVALEDSANMAAGTKKPTYVKRMRAKEAAEAVITSKEEIDLAFPDGYNGDLLK